MIDILMAVYNGERYLAQQIDSILAQTYEDWRLIICDDLSKDNSFKIISDYASKYPEKIKVYKNDIPTGSAQGNFMGMLKYADAEYVMFSDQDDFWLPEKLEITMNRMVELEKEEKGIPVLVHSQLFIADSDLNITHNSFTEFQGLKPSHTSLNRLLVQNNVTGCTIMINKALFELIRGVPSDKMLMHDWWFAITASAFGKIGFIDQPLIKYRQHGGNQLGASNNRSLKKAVQILRERSKSEKRISVTYSQAESFLDFYRDALSEECRVILERYVSIPEKSKLSRIATLIKYKYLKQNFMTAVGQLMFC